MNGLPLLRSASQLSSRVKSWRAFGETVALVAIVGAPHPGHADRMRAARGQADRVLAALVPPVGMDQSAAAEVRPEEARAARMADEAGADALYAPAAFRPAGFASHLHVTGLSDVLEAEDAPGCFDAFAADMTRLFSQTKPDVAVFCEARFQRFAIARRLALDFDLCDKVVAVELERDASGVPVCEADLSEADRAASARLWRTLRRAAVEIEGGAHPDDVLDAAADMLADAGLEVEYLDLRDETTLEEVDAYEAGRPSRIFGAVLERERRFTDNMALGRSPDALG